MILFFTNVTQKLTPLFTGYFFSFFSKAYRRIRNERGTNIVIATHNMYQVKRIADRVGILLNGELIEVNSRGKIFGGPEDSRTRAFVEGEMIY